MEGGEGGEDRELDVAGMIPTQRIQYLERSLLFLRQQHSDVLRALHGEVEELKRENKDLQHKAVMIQKQQQHSSPLSAGDSSTPMTRTKQVTGSNSKDEGREDVKVIFLEEEIKELKHALREARNKNTVLQQRLEQSEDACKRQHAALESIKQQKPHGASAQVSPPLRAHVSGGDPIHSQTAGPGPAPAHPQSLAEYQTIIKQLQQINERQAHELESLKSDLRDVLYSHKWTPDAYLLAKAYVSDDDKKRFSSAKGTKSALPKISVKDRGQPLSDVGVVQDQASLPALRQSVGTKAMERRKRVQLMQKDKLRKQIVRE
ncbi:uncharacterized protein LOC143288079 [Babylonia areolata]|uniref:uncharacterized protein LOC143288079 n=1 Tax=Babylonia areolata TaxID=304850 RepID=UPI003FD3AB91